MLGVQDTRPSFQMVPISTDLMQQAEQVATDLGSSATNDDKDLLEVHCWDHEEIRHFNITHTHVPKVF